jgi:hypothetical protein
MARLGDVCWNVCADLADSCKVTRPNAALAIAGVGGGTSNVAFDYRIVDKQLG